MTNSPHLWERLSLPSERLWLGQGSGSWPNDKSVADAAALRQKAKRVVIVEDEMFVALHLETVLQDLGLEVCQIVATGGAAVEASREYEPDIIFMDINLRGDIDGVEAARRIRQAYNTPIIFVTAYGDEAMLKRVNAVAPGASIIQKPPMTAALVAAISKAIGN